MIKETTLTQPCPECGNPAQLHKTNPKSTSFICNTVSCNTKTFSIKYENLSDEFSARRDSKFANSDLVYRAIYPNRKIWVFDIETSFLKGSFFNPWGTNMTMDLIDYDWFMHCWSGKYIGEPTIYNSVQTPREAENKDDKRLTVELWEHFNNADVIIAHNGLAFDIPRCNQRFLFHGLNPPSPYKVVDTKKIAAKTFKFTHNKLDYIAQKHLSIRKQKTDQTLWAECYLGNPEALQQMVDYCDQDVIVLEEIYELLLPWAQGSHLFNYNLIREDGEVGCPRCKSKHIHPVDGKFYMASVNKYQAWQCSNCGGWARETKNSLIATAR